MNKLMKYVAIMFGACLFACDDNETEISDQGLDEITFSENIMAESGDEVDEVIAGRTRFGFGKGGIKGGLGGFLGCATISEETPEDADYPLIITVDYTEACDAAIWDITKSGKIIITLTGAPDEAGSQRIITYDNYVVNDHLIEGTRTFTNNGDGSHTVTLVDGKITTPEGAEITRTSTRTKTLVSGGDTEDRSDDVFEITGSASGTNAEGLSYSKTITSPLVKRKDCFWITSGIIEENSGDDEVVVDFGDGTCDNLATRTENGVSEEIEMNFKVRRKKR